MDCDFDRELEDDDLSRWRMRSFVEIAKSYHNRESNMDKILFFLLPIGDLSRLTGDEAIRRVSNCRCVLLGCVLDKKSARTSSKALTSVSTQF